MKRQGNLNIHIIFDIVLVLFTKNYQNLSMLDKITVGAVFWRKFRAQTLFDHFTVTVDWIVAR